jgi:peptidoglycan hydrolase-like protein with peptidoglycan-binding domain
VDVKELQIFLNNNGFTLDKNGSGSPGKETTIFGLKTKLALAKFQEAYAAKILTPAGFKKGTGILGPNSRKFINSFFKK